MNITLASGRGRWSLLLTAIKAYTVAGPLVLVLLVRGLGLDGSDGLHVVTLGYVVSFIVLVISAIAQAFSEHRAAARSSIVFAAVALLWIIVLVLLLPSLAST